MNIPDLNSGGIGDFAYLLRPSTMYAVDVPEPFARLVKYSLTV